MLKGLTSAWKNGCNAKTLTLSEYIIIDNKKIPVKADLKDDCYNNGNFIGTFIFKEISFEVENNIDFKRKEFEYYKVVNGEAIKFGTFITTEITDNDTTELVKVVGMDFGLKTQVEYMSSLDYSSGLITLLDVWNECCELSGLVSGITDFTNSGFIVESDQFTGTGATIRDVFVAIAQSSCSFVKIMNDDKIYLIFNEYESNKKNGKAVIIDNSIYNTNLKLQLYGKSVQAISTNPASPSPDYPSEITNIASNIKIEISGKNRWNNYLVTNVEKNTDEFTMKSLWATDILTPENLLKMLKPSTKYTIKIVSKVINKPTTLAPQQIGATYDIALYKASPYVFIPFNTYDKKNASVGDINTTYATITTPTDLVANESGLTDYRLIGYSFFGNDDGSTSYKGSGSIEIQQMMIVEGEYTENTFPQYEPYTEEVVNIDLKGNELCSLPNGTKDELIVKDGRAKITKRIGKVVLDGSEKWSSFSLRNGSIYFTVNYWSSDFKKVSENETATMSNLLKSATMRETWLGKLNTISLASNGNYLQICMPQTIATTLDEFKTWLSTHNTTTQYELAEPEEIDLGEITTLKTFNGTTYITNSEDAEMSVEYSIINEVIEDYTDLDDKRDTKPITCVRLGMSQIVGENLDLKDDELVKKYGEHWLIINDNPFAYTQKKREELIYAILDKIKGFGYSAFSAKTSFKPYLTCGDIIKFKNKNGELINSILLRYEHNYDEITLEAPSETSATVNYVYPANAIDLYKKAEAKIDKEANNITLLTEQTKTLRENLESDYYKKTNINELLQTAESGITNTFSEAGGNNIFRNTGLWFKADTANIQNLYNESFIYCTYNSDAVNKSLTNVYPSSTSVTSYIRSEELMEINSAYEYSLDVPELTYKHGDTTLSYKTSLLELTSNREFQLENGEILKHELSAGSSTIKFKNNTAYVMLLLENQNFSRNILVGDDLNGKTIYSSLPDNFYETLNEQAVTTSMFVKTSTSNAIGIHTQLAKGLFNVGCNTISNFEQSIMPTINFYVKNDITTVNEKSLTMSDTFGTVTEIDENNLAYPYLKIGIDTNLEIADAKTTLKELSIQIKTSDNLYEFWEGEIVRNSNDEATNNNSMLLLNGEVYQEQEVPNGNYAVSFMYQKLNELANASVLINDKEYQLDSTELKQFYTGEQDNETKEYITQPVEVTTNHIRITFKCDVDNAVEIYDLMCNKGTVKLAYSQNENETTTETVNISKGITITSTNMETIFKANANGIKILTLQNATIAYFTDKGLSTKELIVEDEAQICGVLIQSVGDQTWFTRM